MNVVLIEASEKTRAGEAAVLRAAGMNVRLISGSATEPIQVRDVDVVVVDLRHSGFRPAALLRWAFELRRPVVIITNPDQVDARLLGMHHGVTDHLVAPTAARELVERVRHAATSGSRTAEPAMLSIEIDVDPSTRTIHRGSRQATLTPAEMQILVALLHKRGELVSKSDLATQLTNARPNTVEVHVSALRKKLDELGAPNIKTVHGRGYVYRPALERETLLTRTELVERRRFLVQQREDAVSRREEIVEEAKRRREHADRDGTDDS